LRRGELQLRWNGSQTQLVRRPPGRGGPPMIGFECLSMPALLAFAILVSYLMCQDWQHDYRTTHR
jgi:hypothetical protein